jgi:hypothetical protein
MTECYVGTYGKYNAGSIDGKWLKLADFQNYQEFLTACKQVHKNERSPEFMILDWSRLPDGFSAVEWISESDFNDIKQAMQEEEKAAVQVIDYSEKAIALVGDTKTIKDQLKKMGGKFNPKLSCGAGWVFPKSKLEEVQKFLQVGEMYKAEPKTKKDEQLWADYKALLVKAHGESLASEYFKDASNLMRAECGIIIAFNKERIKTEFCWADEGEPYEHYKQVHKTQDSLQQYFLYENLRQYDDLIKELETRKRESGEIIPVFYDIEYYSIGKLGYANGVHAYRWYQVNDSEQDPRTRDLIHRMSDNEIKQAIAILKEERAKFEKRLHTYLKRYGTSKLHTWTYWADR